MATPTAPALQNAFWNAVSYFSKDNFSQSNYQNGLKTLLDPRVKMKKIDDVGYYDEEVLKPNNNGEVTDYFLNGHGFSDKASFIPDNSSTSQPEFLIVGNTGFVSGTGMFVDINPPPTGYTPRRIAYSFAFSSASGDWKAIFLWGKDKKQI